ncbi:hypothetical protein J6590_003519 [Homalodisca vitripennis]|nr:hypothetical protein J6590_003519 [Homalodisca vitripennis]
MSSINVIPCLCGCGGEERGLGAIINLTYPRKRLLSARDSVVATVTELLVTVQAPYRWQKPSSS